MIKTQFVKMLIVYVMLFGMAVLAFAWLWDRWLLLGPYGPYRWEGMDFAPYWVGVRAMLHGTSPYHSDVTRQIQQIVYGGPVTTYDPMLFVYPAWLFLPVLPLTLLPYKWAAIVYSSALLAAILLFLWALADRLGITLRAKSIWFGALVVGTLPFLVLSVAKGQLGYAGMLMLFLAYRFFDVKPVGGGIALSLALLKPSATFVPVVVFLIASVFRKNWKFLLAFSGGQLALLVTSCLAIGNWCGDYLHVVITKGDAPILWSLDLLPLPWNVLYGVFFLGIGGWQLGRSFQEASKAWFPAAILVSIALLPMRWIYDLFFGYLILVDKKAREWQHTIFIAAAILAPWLLVLMPLGAHGAVSTMVGVPLAWALVVWQTCQA